MNVYYKPALGACRQFFTRIRFYNERARIFFSSKLLEKSEKKTVSLLLLLQNEINLLNDGEMFITECYTPIQGFLLFIRGYV